ncbi:arginase family protein [Actinotalea sp. AC32]|nr:arginase family protein [Actinotalea sp. AC32]
MVALSRDLELVVPLWRGGGDERVVAGAEALAALVPQRAPRAEVRDPHGPAAQRPPVTVRDGGVLDAEAVVAHGRVVSTALRDSGASRVVALGGDCAMGTPVAAALLDQHPDLRVIWVDAHGDLNTPATSPSGLAYGMPLRALLGDGHPGLVPDQPLRGDHAVLLGVRELDPAERAFLAAGDVAVLPPAGAEELVAAVLDRIPAGAPVHVHLDLDVLDPDVFPAVAVPTPGGLDVPTLTAVATALRGHADVVGLTVTEYVPEVPHDPAPLVEVLRAFGA